MFSGQLGAQWVGCRLAAALGEQWRVRTTASSAVFLASRRQARERARTPSNWTGGAGRGEMDVPGCAVINRRHHILLDQIHRSAPGTCCPLLDPPNNNNKQVQPTTAEAHVAYSRHHRKDLYRDEQQRPSYGYGQEDSNDPEYGYYHAGPPAGALTPLFDVPACITSLDGVADAFNRGSVARCGA